MTEIEEYKREALEAIANAKTLDELDAIKRATIGRNGAVTEALRELWNGKEK